VAAFDLNAISDVRVAVKMRFRATKLHIEASQPNAPLLTAPFRHEGAQGLLSTRSSKLDGCRAEVDDETPKLNIAFPNGSKRYRTIGALTCSGQVAACPDSCTNDGMKHDSLEILVRLGAHNKRKARWRTWMAFCRADLSKPRQKNSMSWQNWPLQPQKRSANEEVLGLGGTRDI
jgi:hypothetical protein